MLVKALDCAAGCAMDIDMVGYDRMVSFQLNHLVFVFLPFICNSVIARVTRIALLHNELLIMNCYYAAY